MQSRTQLKYYVIQKSKKENKETFGFKKKFRYGTVCVQANI